MTEFITPETIQEFPTLVILVTIITELIKDFLTTEDADGVVWKPSFKWIKFISFFVGFAVSFIILYAFDGHPITLQTVLLNVANSILITVAANGLYDNLNDDIP